jgi:predicted DCC family thiol-disulfide oxidoreductase YuxK
MPPAIGMAAQVETSTLRRFLPISMAEIPVNTCAGATAPGGKSETSIRVMKPAPYSYRGDPAVPAFTDDHLIFFFDGVCVPCNGFADFIIRHDRAGTFRLAAAQSPVGQAMYRHYGLDPIEFTSNLLLAEGLPLFKSEAFIETMSRLPAPWPLFRLMRIAPRRFP